MNGVKSGVKWWNGVNRAVRWISMIRTSGYMKPYLAVCIPKFDKDLNRIPAIPGLPRSSICEWNEN